MTAWNHYLKHRIVGSHGGVVASRRVKSAHHGVGDKFELPRHEVIVFEKSVLIDRDSYSFREAILWFNAKFGPRTR